MEKKQDKRKLLKELDGLKTKALQRGGKLPPPEGKTEAFLDVEAKRILKEAKNEKITRKIETKKDVANWAKEEAGFIAKKMKNAVTITGGLGMGKPNVCGICGETVAHTITTFDEEQKRMICKCDFCREEGRQPRKAYLKSVV
ncbi:hypothetical protein KA005_10835, partial [bacterium]|nr:hypothetical protein [bacterium]